MRERTVAAALCVNASVERERKAFVFSALISPATTGVGEKMCRRVTHSQTNAPPSLCVCVCVCLRNCYRSLPLTEMSSMLALANSLLKAPLLICPTPLSLFLSLLAPGDFVHAAPTSASAAS